MQGSSFYVCGVGLVYSCYSTTCNIILVQIIVTIVYFMAATDHPVFTEPVLNCTDECCCI